MLASLACRCVKYSRMSAGIPVASHSLPWMVRSDSRRILRRRSRISLDIWHASRLVSSLVMAASQFHDIVLRR
jgi:hypothetical protein